jgi:rieske iron-sulfur protein
MNHDTDAEQHGQSIIPDHRVSRRELLKGVGSCVGASAIFCVVGSVSAIAETKEAAVPQVGDALIFFTGPKKGTVVSLNDLVIDAPPVIARAKCPATGVVRDRKGYGGMVLLLRVKPESVPPELQEGSPQGVLAYSAWCTHLGCLVELWDADKRQFQCPCHKSAYDPLLGAQVVFGPAPRALPILPLKIEDNLLVVAGEFSARVGPQRS